MYPPDNQPNPEYPEDQEQQEYQDQHPPLPEQYSSDYQPPNPHGPAPVNPNHQYVPPYQENPGYQNPPYQQQYQQPGPSQGYPPPQQSSNAQRYAQLAQGKSGNRATAWLIIGGASVLGCFGIVLIGLFTIFIAGAAFLSENSAPTHILTARDIDQGYLEIMKSHGYLNDTEKVIYLYSDAISFEDTYYAVTDENVIIYDDILNIYRAVSYSEIIDVDAAYADNIYWDGTCTIYLQDGTAYDIPISSENGTDADFVDEIMIRSGL